ncbi:hypothetical protein [Natronococcus sp. A-GB7]|uniref:hypothetical protein n=1 Tax=Natronococcus sp. A-GB7 TaxID=3037649 RepID=UPI00241C4900|nr:hypothetical protein [Natronococcus sp. A-GB7]MDG5817632.1 hypothetical protein [Natronococcus sp. A-GB7]
MTEPTTAERETVARRNQYREWMGRSIGVGLAGLFAAIGAWLFVVRSDVVLLAGLALYYLGFVGYLLVWGLTSVALFDERERRIENEAGGIVATATTIVVVFGVPGDVVLETTGLVAVPDAVHGAIYGYFLLVVGYLVVYGYVSRRYS